MQTVTAQSQRTARELEIRMAEVHAEAHACVRQAEEDVFRRPCSS
jgi:hypothetical protein